MDPPKAWAHVAGMGRPPKKHSSQVHNRPQWAQRLLALRTLAGSNQTEFAAKLGVSQQRYGAWETGQTEPDVSHWIKIALLLNTSVDYIMRGAVPPFGE